MPLLGVKSGLIMTASARVELLAYVGALQL